MRRGMPDSVRTVRVLVFVAAALHGLLFLVGMVIGQFSGVAAAYLMFVCWPGIFALAFGLRMAKGGSGVRLKDFDEKALQGGPAPENESHRAVHVAPTRARFRTPAV